MRAPWAVVGSDTLSNGSSAQLPRVFVGRHSDFRRDVDNPELCAKIMAVAALRLPRARTCASGVTLLKHSPNP